ncbi:MULTISPECIES: hypothetical protein [unclassified Paenibacillus]|uniref:hypothetical protein n=1 Tax=unclassified Paenibacillus TaxID=185978 RepID=UPI003016B974
MNLYKFEITVNGFLLRTHFSSSEGSGLAWCKKYASKFQKEVANLEIKVAIHKREKQKNNWEYHGKPYIYDRTMKKPARKPKEKNPPE